ncbi:uncharacterized protein LOC132196176 [Neocloeon triangulifer]|uniref:uncharacterized protein LOC132196176 n=1 Tax=Neocloeon triangulifer TaxID=2078957 RepID=UPI00286EE924|nr:uncharacterized protein LOC132196176 [Neocloeon triangulifer]
MPSEGTLVDFLFQTGLDLTIDGPQNARARPPRRAAEKSSLENELSSIEFGNTSLLNVGNAVTHTDVAGCLTAHVPSPAHWVRSSCAPSRAPSPTPSVACSSTAEKARTTFDSDQVARLAQVIDEFDGTDERRNAEEFIGSIRRLRHLDPALNETHLVSIAKSRCSGQAEKVIDTISPFATLADIENELQKYQKNSLPQTEAEPDTTTGTLGQGQPLVITSQVDLGGQLDTSPTQGGETSGDCSSQSSTPSQPSACPGGILWVQFQKFQVPFSVNFNSPVSFISADVAKILNLRVHFSLPQSLQINHINFPLIGFCQSEFKVLGENLNLKFLVVEAENSAQCQLGQDFLIGTDAHFGFRDGVLAFQWGGVVLETNVGQFQPTATFEPEMKPEDQVSREPFAVRQKGEGGKEPDAHAAAKTGGQLDTVRSVAQSVLVSVGRVPGSPARAGAFPQSGGAHTLECVPRRTECAAPPRRTRRRKRPVSPPIKSSNWRSSLENTEPRLTSSAGQPWQETSAGQTSPPLSSQPAPCADQSKRRLISSENWRTPPERPPAAHAVPGAPSTATVAV